MSKKAQLTEEIGDKIKSANVANVVKKVKDGKILTRRDEEILEAAKKPHARPRKEKDNGLPIYYSQAACSSATGIPLTMLRQCSKSCPQAFIGSRIKLEMVLRWIFSRDEASVDWIQHGKKFDALISEAKYEELTQMVVLKEAVEKGAAAAMNVLFSGYDRAENELPPRVKGLTEVEIQTKLKEYFKPQRELISASFEGMKPK